MQEALAKARNVAELTFGSIALGLLLSVVMGAANVYLGLKAGMTVSASIPAAVLAMGILRGIFGRGTILECNQVQTAASAGESLAAGIIFTMPALVIAGIWTEFDFWTTTVIALAGGLLGILFMIPMRRVFVLESKELAYPEAIACYEVLHAGEADDDGEASGAGTVLKGILIGGIFKLLASFVGLIKGAVEIAFVGGRSVFFLGADISPALVGVGWIVGLNISLLIFIGGSLGWLIGIPLLGGADTHEGASLDLAWTLWSTKIRYVGVGAMVVGGMASIVKVRAGLVSAVVELKKAISAAGKDSGDDEADGGRDLDGRAIVALAALSVLLIGGLYFQLTGGVGLTVLTTVIMIIMAFFFTAVASYIVGLVGNSNSPVSGMTITAVLFTGGMLLLFGFSGEAGILATLGVAGVVCCAACTSGDVCNDLKTGALVGAAPRRQQLMQVLAVVIAAPVMWVIMTVLHEGTEGGIGGKELSAPQASLFASLAKGFFGDGQLPWDMVGYGAAVGVIILIVDGILESRKATFRLHLMPVAVGIYLPFGLSVPILIGGLMNHFIRRGDSQAGEARVKEGVLIASGIIAGESLMGVAVAVLAFFGISKLNLGLSNVLLEAVTLGAFVAVVAAIYKLAAARR